MLTIWRGDDNIFNFWSLLGLSFGRRITPANRIKMSFYIISQQGYRADGTQNTAASPMRQRYEQGKNHLNKKRITNNGKY